MKNITFSLAMITLLSACGAKSSEPQIAVQNETAQTKSMSAADVTKLVSEFIPQGNGKTDNRYSTALFGIAKSLVANKATVKFETLEIATPYLTNGKLTVQIHKSPDASAPLAIILNPLYSGGFADQMVYFQEYFAHKNYNVIVFTNTWAPEFIKKGPSFFPGDIWTEGRMHLELIDQIVASEFGREHITTTTLVGMSYGAFMSGVVKAYDQRRTNPLIDGPTLVINPPHDIMHSLQNLDRQTRELSKIDGAKCLLNGGFFKVLQQAIKVDDFNKTSMNEACAKYLLTTIGFNVTLKYSVASLNKSKKLGLSLGQIAHATYEDYVKNIAKLKPSAADSDLGYWMNDARSNGYDGFTVLISRDDSINEGNDLSLNKYFRFDARNLIVLPTGGHTGFREAKSTNPLCSKDWTLCLMNAIY